MQRSTSLSTRPVAALRALIVLLVAVSSSRAQEGAASFPIAARGSVAPFPTPRMVELLAARLADDCIDSLQPSEPQRAAARAALQSRAARWFEERREPVLRAVSQYIEMTLESGPPAANQIGEWSREALPLLDEAQDLFADFAREVRLGLNAEQAARWEAEQAAARVAFSFARSKLTIWRDGGFDPQLDWPGGTGFAALADQERSLLFEAQKQARAAAPPIAAVAPVADALPGQGVTPTEAGEIPLVQVAPPPELLPLRPSDAEPAERSESESKPSEDRPVAMSTSRPTAPVASQPAVDEWHDEVRAFCRRYALNADQDRRAMVFLREAQRRRDRYQESRLAEFRRIEGELRSPGEKNFAQLQSEYERLRAPIDHAKRQLLERLNTIPTVEQRRAVGERADAPTSRPSMREPKG